MEPLSVKAFLTYNTTYELNDLPNIPGSNSPYMYPTMPIVFSICSLMAIALTNPERKWDITMSPHASTLIPVHELEHTQERKETLENLADISIWSEIDKELKKGKRTMLHRPPTPCLTTNVSAPLRRHRRATRIMATTMPLNRDS